MDANYSFALLSFLVGALSGYQGIYEKYGRGSAASVTTLPGVTYLLTRGLLAAGAFVILYYTHSIQRVLPLEALGLGAGTEVVLRSKIYVRAVPQGRTKQDILKGPLDLLQWYQNLFLEAISERLGIIRQKTVTKYVRRITPSTTFFSVCDRVGANADALGQERAQLKAEILDEISKLKKEFSKEGNANPTAAEKESKYIRKLAYSIYHKGGELSLKMLFAET